MKIPRRIPTINSVGNAVHSAIRSSLHLGAKLNLSDEVKSYIEGLSTPLSTTQKRNLDTFVKDLKTGLNINALSDAFDVMYILANETSEAGLRNLVKRAHDATVVNSPVFTQFEGFKGNSAGGAYIALNYAPATEAVNVQLNDVAYGVYTMQNPAAGDEVEFGDVNFRTIIYTKAGTNQSIRIHTDGYDGIAVDDRVGLTVAARSSATHHKLYRNNVKLLEAPRASVSLPGAMRLLTATTQYSNNQISFAFAGRSFIDAELTVIYNAITDYLNTVFF